MHSTKNLYPDVTGVLLAGGRSQRMGRDKALLEIDGEPLYCRIIAVMQELFDRILIAGDRPDLECPEIKSYPDTYPGSSLAGVHNGLTAAQSDWIFIVPCDMPFPDRRIFEQLLQHRDNVNAVVPVNNGKFEPVFALYHKSCLPHIVEMLDQKNFRIQDLFTRISAFCIDTTEFPKGWQRSMANVNTPADLQHILQQKT
jgi:molybdopterin-guanine dinucleotide biosynthesis protein A